jgi:hypothetical protein
MKQISIGREPDFLMKQGQIEMMHVVTVQIAELNSQSQTVKIVDRSLCSVSMKLRNLVDTKALFQSWDVLQSEAESECFVIRSDRFEFKITPQPPSQLNFKTRKGLRLILFNNMIKFSK